MHLAFVNGSNKRDFYVMRKEAKTCAYLLEPFSLNVRSVCVKVFFASPLANDASICYGMSWLSFLIMEMYRMLFDVFRYRINDS